MRMREVSITAIALPGCRRGLVRISRLTRLSTPCVLQKLLVFEDLALHEVGSERLTTRILSEITQKRAQRTLLQTKQRENGF